MLVSSLEIEQLTLQDDPFASSSQFVLTDVTLLDGNNPTVRLLISTDNLNSIKISPVASSASSTYLSHSSQFITDTSSVPISAISSNNALLVATYAPDTTAPKVSII